MLQSDSLQHRSFPWFLFSFTECDVGLPHHFVFYWIWTSGLTLCNDRACLQCPFYQSAVWRPTEKTELCSKVQERCCYRVPLVKATGFQVCGQGFTVHGPAPPENVWSVLRLSFYNSFSHPSFYLWLKMQMFFFCVLRFFKINGLPTSL